MVAVLGIITSGTGNYNYNVRRHHDSHRRPRQPQLRESRRRVLRPGYLEDQTQLHVHLRPALLASCRPCMKPTGSRFRPTFRSAPGWTSAAPWRIRVSPNQVRAPSPLSGDGGRPLYPDHKNWPPRLAMAYSPIGSERTLQVPVRRPGQDLHPRRRRNVLRQIGQPLAAHHRHQRLRSFDLALHAAERIRFDAASALHRLLHIPFAGPVLLFPAAPTAGFPATYPNIVRYHQFDRRSPEGSLHHEPGFQHRPRIRPGGSCRVRTSAAFRVTTWWSAIWPCPPT